MTIDNRRSRRTVLLWLALSSALSIGWGYWICYTNAAALGDFRAIYFAARTGVEHRDPYDQLEFLTTYRQQGGEIPTEPVRLHSFHRAIPICVNVPPTLFLVVPFALLNWATAHILWMLLMPAGLILAAWWMWDLLGRQESRLTLFLICLLLANCQVLLQLGNASGIAVILCATAIWCFVKERFQTLGMLSLAIGLAFKPQEIGFIWLYFLLTGGIHRRRALQSAAIACVIVFASVAWISSVSPHWVHEWQSNVAATTVRGDLNDPGPTSIGNTGLGQVVSMQSVISFFRDDPRIYNPAAYLLAGTLILVWMVVAFRSRYSQEGMWLAIASISALSLLPFYHRQYDCKLLLLTIPAVAVLPALGDPIRKLGLWVTAAGIALTADIPGAILVQINKQMHLPQDQIAGKFFSILLARTPTLVLLLVGVFYLWAFVLYAWPLRSEAASRAKAIGTDGELAIAVPANCSGSQL